VPDVPGGTVIVTVVAAGDPVTLKPNVYATFVALTAVDDTAQDSEFNEVEVNVTSDATPESTGIVSPLFV